MTQRPRHLVQIAGSLLPRGSSAIHFYYSKDERRRFLSFLLDGICEGEGVVLACTREGYNVLGKDLDSMRLRGPDSALIRVELSKDVARNVSSIAEAVQAALRQHPCGRVLADFASLMAIEKIFELEASLSAALRELPVVLLTQYDGRSVPAPITIEQFKTHALAVVGNVLYNENSNYTPPERYFRKRAAHGRG